MPSTDKLALGLDFGTESVRALLVDLNGNEQASAVVKYKHGQILDRLPSWSLSSTEKLPVDFALQHPYDWLDSSAKATKSALKKAGASGEQVIGIGVDFTSCTMLPVKNDGTPLCVEPQFASVPHTWPKLWKHHGAKLQTERINQIAQKRKESFLDRYGGIVGLEWFQPKMLEVIQDNPEVNQACDVWIEAGDWFVWQLINCSANDLPRSTCQAGYKALWSAEDGYPSQKYFKSVHPLLADATQNKMPGRFVAPGVCAGELCEPMAKKIGLKAGTPVSAAIIDAHAGVPGAGADTAGALVMVMGTSSCYMINSDVNASIPGVAGVVKDGILPGYYGYETGQAAVGDAFDWYRRMLGEKDYKHLDTKAAECKPGCDGLVFLDWINGCRTPLMDGSLTGGFHGFKMHHQVGHVYRSMMEGTAYGLRWIVESLEGGGVPVKQLIATGGLPHHNPLLVQIYADVLGKKIQVHPCQHGPALGAAILGAMVAPKKDTGFTSVKSAIQKMSGNKSSYQSKVILPDKSNRKLYERLYGRYRDFADYAVRSNSK